jgi:hypothetical protein
LSDDPYLMIDVLVHRDIALCAATVSWCVANPGVGDGRLKTALDYACGHGADCGPIQTGGACFQPDTMASHASYAFNSYYQRNSRARVACDFSGSGSVVYQQPSEFKLISAIFSCRAAFDFLAFVSESYPVLYLCFVQRLETVFSRRTADHQQIYAAETTPQQQRGLN